MFQNMSHVIVNINLVAQNVNQKQSKELCRCFLNGVIIDPTY